MSKKDYIVTEYKALGDYFGKVITFRFTTASLFLAAVALIIGLGKDVFWYHSLLLFAMAVGFWIVELRHRGIYENLLQRGREIEKNWADNDLPLFRHLTPCNSADEYPNKVPEHCKSQWDITRIFRSDVFISSAVSHTVGLDIIYLSVIVYALLSFIYKASTIWGSQGNGLLSFVAMFTSGSFFYLAGIDKPGITRCFSFVVGGIFFFVSAKLLINLAGNQ